MPRELPLCARQGTQATIVNSIPSWRELRSLENRFDFAAKRTPVMTTVLIGWLNCLRTSRGGDVGG
jgi:hypothetical protein